MLGIVSLLITTVGTSINAVEKSQFEQKLLSRDFSLNSLSGTNVGGGYGDSPIYPEEEWCQERITLLQRSLHSANRKLNAPVKGGQSAQHIHYEAIKVLVRGLNRAAEQEPGSNVFTRIAVETGLQLVEVLNFADPKKSPDQHETDYYTLVKYFEFVIEQVANKLDLQGYIPYLKATESDYGHFRNRLERRFVAYAQIKLDWINRYLARVNPINPDLGELRAVPRGSAKNYLAAAQIVALSTAQDLANSLWEFRFSCAIKELMVVSESLRCYLGECDIPVDDIFIEEFYGPTDAVNFTYFSIQRIKGQIEKVSSCDYN